MKKLFAIVLLSLAIIMMAYNIDIIKKYIDTPEKIPDDIKADLNMTNTPIPIYQNVQTMPDTNNAICQKSINSEYGGIAGSENSPPNGTIVIKNRYGDMLATGICGMYWNIAGWWFNESEMMNLPSESVMYKISPYALTDGDGLVRLEGTEPETQPEGPVAEPEVQPEEPNIQPEEPVTGPGMQPEEPVTEPEVQPTAQPIMPDEEPGIQPEEPVAEPETQPEEPVTEPETQPTMPGTEPVTEPTAQPMTEPITQPVTDPVTQPGTGGGDEDVQEPIAPVPEIPSIILTISGIFTIMMLSRYNK